jgi:type I restriction enzyme S subunit
MAMSEWKECKLGDVLAFGNGKVRPVEEGNIPIYGGNGILGYSNDYNYNEETIVIGRVGAYCGSVYYENQPIWVSDNALSAKPKNNNLTKFFYYYLKHLDLNQFAEGSSHPLVTQTLLNSIDIQMPNSLPEQKSIAEVLSSLDDKIDLLHRQNKTLEAMAEALFRQWFVDEADETWRVGKISDMVNVLSGFAFKSASFIETGKYQLITIKAVQDGQLNLSNADMINDIPAKMPKYCLLESGDILLSLTGNVGRCCLVDTENLLLNQRVAKLCPVNTRDWAFVYSLFRQQQMKSLLEEMAKGTAQANLSPIETSNMEFIIPDENSLQKFSIIVTPWFQKLLFNKKSIQAIVSIRDILLPRLMSGEVRVL